MRSAPPSWWAEGQRESAIKTAEGNKQSRSWPPKGKRPRSSKPKPTGSRGSCGPRVIAPRRI